MDVKEALRSAIQDWIVPEFDKLRLENAEIRTALQLTNKRLDAIQQQLIDQSRRIDETNKRIDETNKRIDETNQRLDKAHADLVGRSDATNQRLDTAHDDLVGRIERVHNGLSERIDRVHAELLAQIERNNMRLDRLYEAIVRREEHSALESRVARLEGLVDDLRQRLVA